MTDKSEFYNTGCRLAKDNSIALLKAAIAAHKIDEEGIACSLTVLSAEESIKAFLCGVKYYYPEHPLPEFEKVFRYHDWKHAEIQRVFGMLHRLNSNLAANVNLFKKEISKWKNRSTDETYQELVRSFQNFAKQYGKMTRFESTYNMDVLIWFSTANELKKQGFYVDDKGGRWHNPREISVNEFVTGLKNASSLQTVVMQFLAASEFLHLLNLYEAKFSKQS